MKKLTKKPLKEKELKERSVVIIEVDGKKYHNNLIDDIRDYETANFGHTTKRITEDNTRKDTTNLIQTLSQTEYFKIIESLLLKDFEEIKEEKIKKNLKKLNRFLPLQAKMISF